MGAAALQQYDDNTLRMLQAEIKDLRRQAQEQKKVVQKFAMRRPPFFLI